MTKSSIPSQQIERIFWKYGMHFEVRFANSLFVLLLKVPLPRTQESMDRDCLEHHGERL